ncbi:hypothetical protein, partial [Anaerosinus sp.]
IIKIIKGENENMSDKIRTAVVHLCILCVGVFLGFYVGTQYYPRIDTKTEVHTVEIEKPIYIEGKITGETETQIAYVPKETIIERYIDAETGKEVTKESLEKTDLDATIGKTEFNVKLNGKDVQFSKSDDEQFLFDKNKVALNQTSTITFDATVTPQIVDKTKRWAIGIGYGTNGTAYLIDFPIWKNDYIGGWAYKDSDVETAGVKINF